ncbi:type II toxin-antitoxin system RelE/ParE family toxin [Pontibacter sp. Tf4]|uniref:type II toxin-antitoxin system RelE/ParE family toxin n=1 Tax=Pontibacter sp. Tf4 TaxID=2761620 RepID=UPI0016267DAD|nr:type II toxin-antitoxin system RelE/ParE family toxin [Pontibacter sp. Tf4]MBB6612988.1 type II toxin-antitoxin system RelE/ParE family toxin [Pontibacter sp. Tf4]
MSYNIIPTDRFKKQAKRLLKKYSSLHDELRQLAADLAQNPTQGTELGHHTYKIRLAVKSKGKGKSGGMRIITYVVTTDKEVYLLTIYDKSEIASLSDKDIKEEVKRIKNA